METKELTQTLKNMAWVNEVVLHEYPNEYAPNQPYKTTNAKFVTEVTVRIPTEKTTRRGKPKPQRRRMDLVAVVLPHIKVWQPLLIGVEVKVSKSDLMGDNKIADYLDYCHLFYLSIPSELLGYGVEKISSFDGVGLLVANNGNIAVFRHAKRREISAENQRDIQSELLIKPLKA